MNVTNVLWTLWMILWTFGTIYDSLRQLKTVKDSWRQLILINQWLSLSIFINCNLSQLLSVPRLFKININNNMVFQVFIHAPTELTGPIWLLIQLFSMKYDILHDPTSNHISHHRVYCPSCKLCICILTSKQNLPDMEWRLNGFRAWFWPVIHLDLSKSAV